MLGSIGIIRYLIRYLRCVKCCTISSRNTTTKKTNFFKWRIIINLECKLRNSILNKETTVKWRQFLNNAKTIKSKQWLNRFVKCNFNAKVRNAVSQLEGYYFVKKKCSDTHKVSKIIIATLYQINKIIDVRKMSQPLPCKLKSQQQQCTHWMCLYP